MTRLAAASRPKRISAPVDREHATLSDLYDRFGATAYSLALSITSDAPVAERIVAASFASAWRHFEQELGSTTTFFADLMTTVRTGAVSHKTAASPGAAFGRADLSSGTIAASVVGALGELGATQQQILALAYFGGFAVGDIAAHLQLPLGAVKAGLKSALLHLRSKVGQQPLVPV